MAISVEGTVFAGSYAVVKFHTSTDSYHRLRGNASPVLTATGFVIGKGNFR